MKITVCDETSHADDYVLNYKSFIIMAKFDLEEYGKFFGGKALVENVAKEFFSNQPRECPHSVLQKPDDYDKGCLWQIRVTMFVKTDSEGRTFAREATIFSTHSEKKAQEKFKRLAEQFEGEVGVEVFGETRTYKEYWFGNVCYFPRIIKYPMDRFIELLGEERKNLGHFDIKNLLLGL